MTKPDTPTGAVQRTRLRRPARWTPVALTALLALTACGSSGDDDDDGTGGGTAQACGIGAFTSLDLPDAQVLTAEEVPAGSYQPVGYPVALDDLPAFCRITAQATPTADSLINFEVWVPRGDDWNGKLVTTGNGGYSPTLSYRDMAYAMRQGYATIGGDTGHQSEDPNAMFWGVGHPEKIRDWGTRSVHAITESGKRVIGALQGEDASRAYYYGCSTGGHQGFAEMQNYPADFDGVIAGAPGHNRTRLNVEFLYRFLSNRPEGNDTDIILTADKAALVTQAAVAACDALDGVTDGVMTDPRACTSDHFDVRTLECTGADDDSCLTAAQVDVVEKIYAGPSNPRTAEQIYPGYPVGSEAGWPTYWGATEPVRADYWRLWVFGDPQWDWWTFDFDRDLTYADAVVSPLVDQRSTDLSDFKAAGGKAIVYHGWQDPVVNPLDTIAYLEGVEAQQGSASATSDFFRLFLVPGMGHCGGGTGATVFGNSSATPPVIDAEHDLLSALDAWVEGGTAPDRLVASKLDADGATLQTRPLCPHPKQAVYSGSGSTDDASNFSCE